MSQGKGSMACLRNSQGARMAGSGRWGNVEGGWAGDNPIGTMFGPYDEGIRDL